MPTSPKVSSTRALSPVRRYYASLATRLSAIPELRYIKLFPKRLSASNALSTDGKNNPVVNVGAAGIVGVDQILERRRLIVARRGRHRGQVAPEDFVAEFVGAL